MEKSVGTLQNLESLILVDALGVACGGFCHDPKPP
jgi:hypothetical protein